MSEYTPRSLLGRCANGAHLDRGTVVHAVSVWTALCGKQPGARSGGWSTEALPEVTCPKCLARLAKGKRATKAEAKRAVQAIIDGEEAFAALAKNRNRE